MIELQRRLRERRVAILGLGVSGVSAAKCLGKRGAKLFLSEMQTRREMVRHLPPWLRRLPSEFGGHTNKILNQDLIVVSPGVNLKSPLLLEARKKGVPIWDELELGYQLGNFKNVIAVTGTNGKTTTVSLIGDIFSRNGNKALVAGNIGKPLCDFVDHADRYDLVVLEVSSYQLEGIISFRPHIAVLLNLTRDHLARHTTMKSYAEAKQRIFLNQTSEDYAILNRDDSWCAKMGSGVNASTVWFSVKSPTQNGIFFDRVKNRIVVRSDGCRARSPVEFPLPVHLPGLHNVENACAAIAVCTRLGVQPDAIRSSLKFFPGVEHRLEKVMSFNGVTFVNDSKGTNVDSTLKALQSFDQPIWLILGGQDKGSSYRPLRTLVSKKVKGIFLIGEAACRIESELRGSCEFFHSGTLARAVRAASRTAVSGDLVLLSPACASFDQFRNFEDRGEQYKQFVRELARPKKG